MSDSVGRTKGSDRIQINNILGAAAIAILSVLLGLSGQRLPAWMLFQLATATPLFVTSSLAYAKVGYRPESEYAVWDALGWATMSVGYIMLLNSLMLMLYASTHRAVSWWFLGATVLLFASYSGLDVIVNRKRLGEKAWKLAFYLALLFCGSVLPILAGWL